MGWDGGDSIIEVRNGGGGVLKSRKWRTVGLALACLACQLVVGCGHEREGVSNVPATQSASVKEALSVTNYPVSVMHRETGAKAQLHVSIHRKLNGVRGPSKQLLAEAPLPYTKGGRYLLLYAINGVDRCLRGQPLPEGFRIEEQATADQLREQGEWMVDLGQTSYSKQTLAIRDEFGQVFWLDKPDVLPSDWSPLNEKTWPDFWRAVESRLQLEELFENASDRS